MATINYEEFVRLWVAGKSDKEIAEELQCRPSSVPYHAIKLKDAGVKLPRRAKKSAPIDANSLNRIIQSSL